LIAQVFFRRRVIRPVDGLLELNFLMQQFTLK
jgi:hypothetical protein